MEADIFNQFDEANPVSFTILMGKDKKELGTLYEVDKIIIENRINCIPKTKIILKKEKIQDGFDQSSQGILDLDNSIEIQAGYAQKKVTLFEGIIVKQNLKFNSRCSYLIITCQHKIIKSAIERKSRSFYEHKGSEVSEAILNEYEDLDCKIKETSVEHRELVQFNTTDWTFIKNCARDDGQICWTTNDGFFHIGSPNINGESRGTLSFGENILDFDGAIETRHQSFKTQVSNQKIFNRQLTENDEEEKTLTIKDHLSSLNQMKKIKPKKLKQDFEKIQNTVSQADGNTQALFQRLIEIRGRLKTNGAPVEPNTILKLEGGNHRFDGKVFVSGVHHEIDENKWVTKIRFGLTSDEEVVSGMLHSSSIPASQTSTDNNSPNVFVTRSQLKMIFNDERKSIQLQTPVGKTISIDEEKDQIMMKDEKGNSVKLDTDGISFETRADIKLKAGGEINLKGMNISQKAYSQMRIEGAAGAEVSSTGSTVVTGGIVQIN